MTVKIVIKIVININATFISRKQIKLFPISASNSKHRSIIFQRISKTIKWNSEVKSKVDQSGCWEMVNKFVNSHEEINLTSRG